MDGTIDDKSKGKFEEIKGKLTGNKTEETKGKLRQDVAKGKDTLNDLTDQNDTV